MAAESSMTLNANDTDDIFGSEHCDFAALYGVGPNRRAGNNRKQWWQFWK